MEAGAGLNGIPRSRALRRIPQQLRAAAASGAVQHLSTHTAEGTHAYLQGLRSGHRGSVPSIVTRN